MSGFRASTGISLHWQAPVGPIVINLGRPIIKKPGDIGNPAVQLRHDILSLRAAASGARCRPRVCHVDAIGPYRVKIERWRQPLRCRYCGLRRAVSREA